MKELNAKTNDTVWQTKLAQFNEIYVERPLSKLKIEISNSNDVFWKKFE